MWFNDAYFCVCTYYIWGRVVEDVQTQLLIHARVDIMVNECVCLGWMVWSAGILLWIYAGLFSTGDAGSVDWNPWGHEGHLIPSLPKHWTKCSCIIHVYITLLLCKVFTPSFCVPFTVPSPYALTDKLSLISLALFLSLSFPLSLNFSSTVLTMMMKMVSKGVFQTSLVIKSCSIDWLTWPQPNFISQSAKTK